MPLIISESATPDVWLGVIYGFVTDTLKSVDIFVVYRLYFQVNTQSQVQVFLPIDIFLSSRYTELFKKIFTELFGIVLEAW